MQMFVNKINKRKVGDPFFSCHQKCTNVDGFPSAEDLGK